MALVDCFLKIDGIDGESPVDSHKGWIQLETCEFGERQAGKMAFGGGGGAGKVEMTDVVFGMNANKASPKLFIACATGQHIKQATVEVCKAGGRQEAFYKIVLTDVLVSSYETSISTRDEDTLPQDSFALNFTAIEFAYRVQNANGTLGPAITAKFDLKRMIAV